MRWAPRDKFTLAFLLALAQRACGGWYNENVYLKGRVHRWPIGCKLLCTLAFIPVCAVRRGFAALCCRLEFTRIELPVTTRCTLRCRDCSNLIPFYPNPRDLDTALLISDLDEVLRCVDRVHSVAIMGGEALLHRDVAAVIARAIACRNVGTVQVVTNGTIVPGEDLLRLLTHKKVVVAVSNYPVDVARRKELLLRTLQAHGINHTHDGGLRWMDMGGFTPVVDTSPAALMRRYKACPVKHDHTLLDGEFYVCPRAAHGARLNQFPDDPGDRVRFRGRRDRKAVRAELRRLCAKPFVTACTKCQDRTKARLIPPAIQLPAGAACETSGVQ